jgi:rubredoxin
VTREEHAPLCPACGDRMKLARVTGRPYGRYRLATYECALCNVFYTEAQSDGDESRSRARE